MAAPTPLAGVDPTPAVPARPRLRLLPAPDANPPATPYLSPPTRSRPTSYVQGALALGYCLPNGLPAVPEVDPALVLLPQRRPGAEGLALGPDGDPADLDGPQPTSSRQLPAPGPWAARLGQAVLEVGTAGRPITQLMRWTNGSVYADLLDRYAPRARQELARRRVVVDERVRSVHVCQPVDGVAEASLVFSGGPRPRALALRLEGWDGRWVCTVCEWL